jgi:hypothetical protein
LGLREVQQMPNRLETSTLKSHQQLWKANILAVQKRLDLRAQKILRFCCAQNLNRRDKLDA